MALRAGWVQPLPYAAAAAAITARAVWLALQLRAARAAGTLGVLGLAALAVANPIAVVAVAVALIPLEVVSVAVGGDAGLSPAEGAFVLAALGWVARRLAAGLPPSSTRR